MPSGLGTSAQASGSPRHAALGGTAEHRRPSLDMRVPGSSRASAACQPCDLRQVTQESLGVPGLRWLNFYSWRGGSPRRPSADWENLGEFVQKGTSQLSTEQAQAPRAAQIFSHAHTGAMSSGLRLSVLLWLLSLATEVRSPGGLKGQSL